MKDSQHLKSKETLKLPTSIFHPQKFLKTTQHKFPPDGEDFLVNP